MNLSQPSSSYAGHVWGISHVWNVAAFTSRPRKQNALLKSSALDFGHTPQSRSFGSGGFHFSPILAGSFKCVSCWAGASAKSTCRDRFLCLWEGNGSKVCSFLRSFAAVWLIWVFPTCGFIFSITLRTTALHVKENGKHSAGRQRCGLAVHRRERGSGSRLPPACLTLRRSHVATFPRGGSCTTASAVCDLP